jgi:hypothetical protein
LENNELVVIPECPFSLPDRESLDFMVGLSVAGRHKDISFDPVKEQLVGFKSHRAEAETRLRELLTSFSNSVDSWIKAVLPDYAPGLIKDRVTLRTSEEATRALRITARNDLLHIDNFSTRPTFGRRILRVYVNIHPSEPQVWAVSERFPQLLDRFARDNSIPVRSAAEWVSPLPNVLGWLTRQTQRRSHYDALMLRLHHFLKQDLHFQTRAARKVIRLQAGSAWLLFSDGLAHAHLRGQYVLEHSFFVEPKCLQCPSEWPVAILETYGSTNQVRSAS